MRLLPALLTLAACAEPSPDVCPPDEAALVEGAACTTAPTTVCEHHGTGVCGAAWSGLYRCTCTGGRWACQDAYPSDGERCDWSAGTSCTREGNPDCQTMPTAGACACDDTTWTCQEACWHTCPAHWDDRWLATPPACSSGGEHCALPGGHTCDCDGQRYACR